MRKYEVIWEQIKKKSEDEEAWVAITVASIDRIQTIINMVQVEKCAANVTRKRLDLPAYGRLQILREPDKKKVSFRIVNSGASL